MMSTERAINHNTANGRRQIRSWLLCFAITFLCSLNVWADSPQVYVQVRLTKLRAAPQHWSAAQGSLSYGQALTKVTAEGEWLKVKDGSGRVGYVHNSAISSRKIVLQSRQVAGREADAADIVLAGKGFNPSVEAEYAAANRNLNFALVDRLEALKVNEKEILDFMRSGGLSAGA